ncbi:hypothetical protein ACQW02_24025 [Humitalea sp. 24SJ18S-53]
MQSDGSGKGRDRRTTDRLNWRAATLLIFLLSVFGWLVVAAIIWLLRR